MRGESVVVHRTVEVGRDPLNSPIFEDIEETVEDVLVAPGPRNDVDESTRPAGTRVAWNIHFPKPYAESLRGAKVSVRGQDPAKVIGDPQPYYGPNTPTRWWLPVELGRVDG